MANTERILKHNSEAEVFCTTETKTDYYKGKRNGYMLTALLQQCPPVEKEKLWGQPVPSIIGHFVEALTLILKPWGLYENLHGPITGNLIVTEKGGGASNNQHTHLGRLIS